MTLTYVTGNYGKYISVKEHFQQEEIPLEFLKYDLKEPNINDIEYISKEKAKEAYAILKTPCFVADTGFYIKNYPNHPNYPGALVKRSGISTNIEKLLKDLEEVKERDAYFLDCLTFYDGQNFYTFYGKSEGVISYEKRGQTKKEAKSNLWYVFIPKNHNHTLAEMEEEEFYHRKDNHTSATQEFLIWYKNEYLKSK